MGFLAATLALILVSFGPEETTAKWLIGGGASLWAMTIGAVLEKFFGGAGVPEHAASPEH